VADWIPPLEWVVSMGVGGERGFDMGVPHWVDVELKFSLEANEMESLRLLFLFCHSPNVFFASLLAGGKIKKMGV